MFHDFQLHAFLEKCGTKREWWRGLVEAPLGCRFDPCLLHNNYLKHTTMKARKYIGAAIAIIGTAAAVSVADGSAGEMIIRGAGVALFVIGAFVGKFFDFQNKTL